MLLSPIYEKDKTIAKQKEENLQVYEENKELREEVEEIRFDLSVANRTLEQKDEVVEKIKKQINRNNYNRIDLQLLKIKELVSDYQSIN